MSEVYNVSEVSSTIKKRERESYGESVDGAVVVTVDHFSDIGSAATGKYHYGIQIVTGNAVDAGTTGNAYVVLVGDKGKTGKLWLRGWFNLRVCSNTFNNLTIESESDLGKIQVVMVGCDAGWIENHWYVSFVTVVNMQSKSVEKFPCYHWIDGETSVSITASTTTKKDVAGNDLLLKQRESELRRCKVEYEWQKFPESGLPSGIDDTVKKLPPDEQFSTVKNINFTTTALQSAAELKIASLFRNVDSLRDYEILADQLGGQEPLYKAGRWTSDIEFGRQIMNGVNPIIIKKCEALPPNFKVTNDMVQPFLNSTLEEEMKAGNIYICDTKVLDGLKSREGYVNVAPICLLYVNKSMQLVPIAIQCKQGVREEEKSNNPIFLPSDNWIDWLLAKIYYRSAHSQIHQTFTHYTSCHATMEAYAIGTKRNLPNSHPIYKLLVPSFRYTMAINTRARATLINPGGVMDTNFGIGGEGLTETWKRCGATYNVHTSNIKRWAKERGVDQLPGYYYRDDGIKVWDALELYVGNIINEFYKTDKDVTSDEELQAWARDIHTNGFPGFHGAPVGHGFPDKMTSKEELTTYCTLIMFTGSAQHASINFLQYDYYRFVPNAPFGVRQPPPAKKGIADYKFLLNTLPEEESAVNIVTITHILSQYSDNELLLGNFKPRFSEKAIKQIVKSFNTTLEGISKAIKERNQGVDVDYIAMLPEKIPNSITI